MAKHSCGATRPVVLIPWDKPAGPRSFHAQTSRTTTHRGEGGLDLSHGHRSPRAQSTAGLPCPDSFPAPSESSSTPPSMASSSAIEARQPSTPAHTCRVLKETNSRPRSFLAPVIPPCGGPSCSQKMSGRSFEPNRRPRGWAPGMVSPRVVIPPNSALSLPTQTGAPDSGPASLSPPKNSSQPSHPPLERPPVHQKNLQAHNPSSRVNPQATPSPKFTSLAKRGRFPRGATEWSQKSDSTLEYLQAQSLYSPGPPPLSPVIPKSPFCHRSFEPNGPLIQKAQDDSYDDDSDVGTVYHKGQSSPKAEAMFRSPHQMACREVRLGQDGLPISSQRFLGQDEPDLSDLFGFSKAEQRVQKLWATEQLEPTAHPSNGNKKNQQQTGRTTTPAGPDQFRMSTAPTQLDSDLSLSDLLAIPKTNSKKSDKAPHRRRARKRNLLKDDVLDDVPLLGDVGRPGHSENNSDGIHREHHKRKRGDPLKHFNSRHTQKQGQASSASSHEENSDMRSKTRKRKPLEDKRIDSNLVVRPTKRDVSSQRYLRPSKVKTCRNAVADAEEEKKRKGRLNYYQTLDNFEFEEEVIL